MTSRSLISSISCACYGMTGCECVCPSMKPHVRVPQRRAAGACVHSVQCCGSVCPGNELHDPMRAFIVYRPCADGVFVYRPYADGAIAVWT